MLWEVDIYAAHGSPDLAAERVAAEAADLGLPSVQVQAARGFLIEGPLDEAAVGRIASQLLVDPV
ncbi:MAG TPA: hypothetical protein VG433_09265, partial [Pirellulales bacterium]|nr:hypothetical protein [Pirellulales bacterium]